MVKRLAEEQITKDNEKITVKVKPETKGTAMVNPHDPNAHYNGHYEKTGYKADFVETCAPDKDTPNPKIITNVEVTKANVADSKIIEPVVEKLEEKDLKPKKLLADNGYDSDNIQQNLRQKDIDFVTWVRLKQNGHYLGRNSSQCSENAPLVSDSRENSSIFTYHTSFLGKLPITLIFVENSCVNTSS